MKFKYKNYGRGILRPVIPIEISYKHLTVSYEALVDSGADFCIFSAQIGEILEIDIEKVVGQKGFFDIFTVKFDLSKEEIELKERHA